MLRGVSGGKERFGCSEKDCALDGSGSLEFPDVDFVNVCY